MLGGTWQINGGSGSGSRTDSDWGELASSAWYSDFDFSGSVTIPSNANSGQLVAVLVRYAGASECYKLVFDWSKARAYILENHYGRSCEVASVDTTSVSRGATINFHITGQGGMLTATFGPQNTTITYQNMLIPGGRVGLGVRGGQVTFSSLTHSGSAAGSYAFHWNYVLPSSFQSQPVWKFLDDCGNSLLTRYQNNFTSIAAFEAYKKDVILKVRQSLGLDPWPERSPLNARVVGTLDYPTFKIDKVIFESQPGFKVDALLYIPKNAQFPAPGVLSPSGHYGNACFYVDSEQGRNIGLAKNGYVVMAYDPIAQGERSWLCPACGGSHDALRQKIDLLVWK
jgi:hypothetical protein